MQFRKIGASVLLCLFMLSLNGCNDEPKAKTEEPKKIVFDRVKAQDLAGKRIASVDIDAKPTPKQSDYIRIVAAQGENGGNGTGFLTGITSDDTKSVVILAHIENGDVFKLPAVPLFIFEKQSRIWTNTFKASGDLSPLFVAQRAPLTISLEMVLLKDVLKDLSDDAAQLIKAYGTTLALYSKEGAHDISALADEFAQRIALVEEASLKDVTDFTISYLESYGNTINLLSATGEVSLALNLFAQGHASVLPLRHNVPPLYNELLAHKIGPQTPRKALEDLEAGFWSVPADVLHPSCQAVHGALKERLGLSERDSALVLWRMMQPHAVFANAIDYQSQCSGEDMAVLLQEMGFALPPLKAKRPSSKTQKAMNKTLSTIASLIKNTKDSNEQRLKKLVAETVLVRDQARLLFSTKPNQIISSATDIIAPSISKDEAAEYIMMLPIQSYGCYSQGVGQVGNHRASLVKMENDPALWLLDFAFNEDNKINGIYLRNATQRDFCRAVGARKGKNRCVFSGKSFPGLTPDKCG